MHQTQEHVKWVNFCNSLSQNYDLSVMIFIRIQGSPYMGRRILVSILLVSVFCFKEKFKVVPIQILVNSPNLDSCLNTGVMGIPCKTMSPRIWNLAVPPSPHPPALISETQGDPPPVPNLCPPTSFGNPLCRSRNAWNLVQRLMYEVHDFLPRWGGRRQWQQRRCWVCFGATTCNSKEQRKKRHTTGNDEFNTSVNPLEPGPSF